MQKVDQKFVSELCQKYDIRPTRRLGQNFLISDKVLNRIVEKADLNSSDVVLEVGPGLGVLTQKLISEAKKVIAVEMDRKLVKILEDRFGEVNNLEIINQDILKFNPDEFGLKNYKIVANLPYQISSKFLTRFLEIENRPSEMILMLQKEVAEKICAEPGNMSLLSVAVQFYAQPEILFQVSKTKFFPAPKVDSTVIKLKIKELNPKIDSKEFFKLVRAGFLNKRQKLKNNLKNLYPEIEKVLKNLKFNPNIRAQELNLIDWEKLYFKIKV